MSLADLRRQVRAEPGLSIQTAIYVKGCRSLAFLYHSGVLNTVEA
jgi:hypothetical protein